MDIVEDARQFFTRGHATPFAGQAVELTACLELTDDITLEEVNGYCKIFSVATMGNGYGNGGVSVDGEVAVGSLGGLEASTTPTVPEDPHHFRQVTLQHPITKALDGTIEGGWTEESLRSLLEETLEKVR